MKISKGLTHHTFKFRYHKRVYKILRTNGFLDENEIIKLCFMPPRDVRKIINTLFQEGIVDTQEVPNKAGNMIMLYSTDFSKIKEFYFNRMVKSLLNVKLRLEDMRQKQTSWTKDQAEAYEAAIAKLYLVVSHLEKSIMIFNEF